MTETGEHAAKHSTGTVPRQGFSGLRAALCALLAASVLAIPGDTASQQASGAGSRLPSSAPRGFPQDVDPLAGNYDPYNVMESQKRLRMINMERQKALVADTDKLLKLADELNRDVAHSSSGELTPAQLRKVAEIEKLAHSVHEKMIMSVRGVQMNNINVDGPPPPFFPSPPSR